MPPTRPCIAPTGRTKTRYQEVPKYEEGLYDLGEGVYTWLVPNGSWGESNAGLLVGEGASALIDTLWDVPYTQQMLDIMAPYTKNAPLTTVINTHADGDHFWGNELVVDKDIITSQASLDEMMTQRPRSLVLLGRLGKVMSGLHLFGNDKAGHWFQQMVAPYDFAGVTHTPAKRGFTGELTLEVGGREIQLIEVGPAHTKGDLMVFLPETKVLFTGDILFVGSTPVMWAGPIDNWRKALDRIEALDPALIVPGHGPLTDLTGVEQVRQYWRFVQKEGSERFQQGLSARDAAQDIVLSEAFQSQPFASWNSPERMMTSIHTHYRHLQGRSSHPAVPGLVNILRKQALLAHTLPDAQPQCMRKR